MPPSPLAGVLVADLTCTGPGPYCTQLLHRLGARVIKFEPPYGDVTRLFPELFRSLNAGKESVVADLRSLDDLRMFLAVGRKADVVTEGWRPGVADRLGVGYETIRALNQSVVYCSLSGYGLEGPLRDRPGHDVNYLAASGLLRLLAGERAPSVPGLPLADLAGGLMAALRIVAGLHQASSSSRGCHIDSSVAGAVRNWVEVVGPSGTAALDLLQRLPAYGLFETADGELLSLGIVHEDHFWDRLCELIGRRDLQGIDFGQRNERAEELRAVVRQVVAERTRSEWQSALESAETCWSFVEHPRAKSAIEGQLGSIRGTAAELDEHSARIREEFHRGRLGEGTTWPTEQTASPNTG